MSASLSLPGIDRFAADPDLRRRGASQWFTPPDIAARMARWSTPLLGRVLEPSAGNGSLVRAWAQRLADAQEYGDDITPKVDAVELDRHFAETHGWECADYLTRAAPAERYALGLSNPPYEDGLDGLFLAKMMTECDRIIALVRLAALAGSGRHASVWSRIESHADGWHMPGLAVFSSRPVFDGPESASGSAKSDFVCVKLSRVSPPSETRVEWWT